MRNHIDIPDLEKHLNVSVTQLRELEASSAADPDGMDKVTENVDSTEDNAEEEELDPENESPVLRHGRDVHPTWVEGRVPCVILTSTEVRFVRLRSEEGLR